MKPSVKILLYIGVAVTAASIILTIRKQQRIKAFAKALVGQKETEGNSGFSSALLEKQMKEVGWQEGDQWCVYFAKLVWYQKAPDWLKPKIKKDISGSSQYTWDAVSKDPTYKVSKTPKVGDMVIWQSYNNGSPLWSGHAGIVTKVGINSFQTVEGNTNAGGSREGYTVAEKVRTYNYDANNGLRLKGFVRFA